MTATDALTRHALRICLASCLLLAGCVASRRHCVVNAGEDMLRDVTVACRQGEFNHGYLVPGAHASYSGGMKLTRGDAVSIRWTGPGGTRHDVSLTLRRHPGSRQVVFTITGSRVELTYEER